MSSGTPDSGVGISWDLSPADFRYGSVLVYAPIAFLGGHVGLVLAGGIVLAPAILGDLGLLALTALLVLVGGPVSLLYLWPMLRDPDQRPDALGEGLFAHATTRGVLVASIFGTIALVGAGQLLGSSARLVLAVVLVVVPLPFLGVFHTEGSLDAEAGTLTVWYRTADITTLDGLRNYRLGTVVVCWLSYVEGAGGFGRPYLVALPETVAADVLETLERGIATDPGMDNQEPDLLARAFLAGIAVLFFGTAGAALLVLDAAAGLLALIAGGLGCLFAFGAYYVA